ncbi:MAG: hypothetical protein MJ246_00740 [Clostridia bacterium]|nr:hypothetical protein [Clostridia bacterium]
MERAEKAINTRTSNGKNRNPQAVSENVDKVFKDLITYMENSQNRTKTTVEITDAIFAGLFEAKTNSTGFSPEMAVKYQDTKDQFFVDGGSSGTSERTTTQTAEEISARGTAHDNSQAASMGTAEQTAPVDDKHVGESMVSVQEEARPQSTSQSSDSTQTQSQTQTQTQTQTETQKKEEPKSILTPADQKQKAGNEAGVGESMFGAGEKITPGAGGSITTEAGGKAFDDSFSAELKSDTGFEISTETYASEHGGESVGNTNKGSEAKSNNVEARATTPQKRENMN